MNPGEQVVLRFKATRAGVFIYHCAPGGAMIPWHVVAGMSGAVMVLPRTGLLDEQGKPLHYDRIYYVGENDFYIPRDENGKYKSYKSLTDSYPDTVQVMRYSDAHPCRVQRQGGSVDRQECDDGESGRAGAVRAFPGQSRFPARTSSEDMAIMSGRPASSAIRRSAISRHGSSAEARPARRSINFVSPAFMRISRIT